MDTNVLKNIADYVPEGIAVFDGELRLRFYNSSWKNILEQINPSGTSQIQRGAYFFDLVPLGEKGAVHVIKRAMAGEIIKVDSFPVELNGVARYWNIVIAPMEEDGAITGTIHVISDTTERMVNARELERFFEDRTSAVKRQEEVAEGLRDIMTVLNSNRPFEYVLDYIIGQAERLFGTNAVAIFRLDETTSLLTIQAQRGLDPDYAANIKVMVGDGGVGRAVETRLPLPQQDLRLLIPSPEDVEDPRQREMFERIWQLTEKHPALLSLPLMVKDEVYGGITLYYPEPRKFTPEEIDLAVTFCNQAALAIQDSRLHEKLEQSAVAAERSRLARDLHDAVTQTLFSASLIADVLPRIWDKNPEEGHKRLEELRQLTRGALAEMRTLLLELRPSALVETELGDLFRQLAEAVTGRARIPVALTIEGHYPLSPDVKIALYRIAQEALNNIAKHSGASKAELRLRCHPEGISLDISDNGRGFGDEQIKAESLGLGIMRERAEAVGAILDIQSEPDKGTIITIQWPGEPRKE